MKNKVKEYRTQSKITQQQLADAVRVSARTIISLEKGQYNPTIMLAFRISEFFGTTIEDLYCLKENKEMEDLRFENLQ